MPLFLCLEDQDDLESAYQGACGGYCDLYYSKLVFIQVYFAYVKLGHTSTIFAVLGTYLEMTYLCGQSRKSTENGRISWWVGLIK